MAWPDSNSHHDVECFTRPHHPTCPATSLEARLWAWLSPLSTPSLGSHKGNSAPLFTGLPVSFNFPSLHSLFQRLSPLTSFSIAGSGVTLTLVLRFSFLLNPRYSTSRDTDRAIRLHPPRWKDVTLCFATKVLNMAGISPGARGHYERLLHKRRWTVGRNSCKGAETENDRKLLLRCPLCASDATSADDTYDHIFRSCQHPLLAKTRLDSDSCLGLLQLSTDLDRRLLPAQLLLLASEDGHRICLGNWSSPQISQLNRVPQPTDTVPALNESLLALSKHFVNRIETI